MFEDPKEPRTYLCMNKLKFGFPKNLAGCQISIVAMHPAQVIQQQLAPINIMPHYFPPGLCREKGGAFDFDYLPHTWEIDCSPYTCTEA